MEAKHLGNLRSDRREDGVRIEETTQEAGRYNAMVCELLVPPS
jgi:hypothetical protein